MEKIECDCTLTATDYALMLGQLEGMLETVCAKSQAIMDSGYRRMDVRSHLAMDAEYSVIAAQAGTLDSMLLKHIYSPASDPALSIEYNKVIKRFSNRATRLGLF